MCLQHWSWGQLLKGKILLQETEGQTVNTQTLARAPSALLLPKQYSKAAPLLKVFLLKLPECCFFGSRGIKSPRKPREYLTHQTSVSSDTEISSLMSPSQSP